MGNFSAKEQRVYYDFHDYKQRGEENEERTHAGVGLTSRTRNNREEKGDKAKKSPC